MKEERIITLRELVARKQIFAPCIWDVMSHRAAAMCGFEATLLSGGAFAGNVCGMPDADGDKVMPAKIIDETTII